MERVRIMKLNDKIMEREKMKAFFQKPQGTLFTRIEICNYENKPAIVITFWNKRRDMIAFRMKAAEYFMADELVEIFKIQTYGGGEIRDDWYDIFSQWVEQIQ